MLVNKLVNNPNFWGTIIIKDISFHSIKKDSHFHESLFAEREGFEPPDP